LLDVDVVAGAGDGMVFDIGKGGQAASAVLGLEEAPLVLFGAAEGHHRTMRARILGTKGLVRERTRRAEAHARIGLPGETTVLTALGAVAGQVQAPVVRQ